MTQATITLNTGTTMPQLGFGTWRVGHHAVRSALEAGYRCIDTAETYQNEADVGAAIRTCALPRDALFVTTKVSGAHHGYQQTLRAFDASRRRLGLDTIDLYLIHWPAPDTQANRETWRAMEKLHAQGAAHAIGVSNFSPDLIDALAATSDTVPAVNQIELHPLRPRRHERAYHARHAIATEAWAPIAKGALLDHPTITAIADAHGRTPAQTILAWHLHHGIIAIPRSATPSRIVQNLAATDIQLSPQDLAAIDALGD